MPYATFADAIAQARGLLQHGSKIVHSGFWQGLDITKSPASAMHEVIDQTFRVSMAGDRDFVAEIQPDLPWADEHFAERVQGFPTNPDPSEERWPHAMGSNGIFKDEKGQFSHTYSERYWPQGLNGQRSSYGDLLDVVKMLLADPLTRQAYLPVWWPEDTGGDMKVRKPCSIGYQFIMRDGQLNVIYQIRSCDFSRHFRNDIYFTVRLTQWVLDALKEAWTDDNRWDQVTLGTFTMHVGSLHLFRNDYIKMFR